MPAGRAACRVHSRGATFFSRQPQALEGPAHRGDTDPDALRVRHMGAEVLQSEGGRGAHRLLEHRLGGSPESALLAPCVRFRRHGPRAPVAAQEFFDKRYTDLTQFCEGALGAESPRIGLDKLVASNSGRRLHALRLPHEILPINRKPLYERHLDAEQHHVGKEHTQQIESKHINLRTRIKRLVRRTLCFSKTERMHDLVIGLFINRYEFGRAL